MSWLTIIPGLRDIVTESDGETLSRSNVLSIGEGLVAVYDTVNRRISLAYDADFGANAESIRGNPIAESVDSPGEGTFLSWNAALEQWEATVPPGSSGDAESLLGNSLDVTTVTSPNNGDVLTFDSGSGEWIATPPPGAGSITGPSDPGDDGKFAVASSGDLSYQSDLTVTAGTSIGFGASVAAPLIGQATDATPGVTADTLTVAAQSASGGGGTAGGHLFLEAGSGDTNGRIDLRIDGNSVAVLHDSSIVLAQPLRMGSSTAVSGNVRVGSQWQVVGLVDGGSPGGPDDVPLFAYGTSLGDLFEIGNDGPTQLTYRSLENHDFYSDAKLQLRVSRNPDLVTTYTSGFFIAESVTGTLGFGQLGTTSGNGADLIIAAQSTSDSEDGGDLVLTSGAGGAADGNVVIATGSTTRVTVHPSELGLDLPAILFGSSVAAPTIRQTLDGTPSATGQTLTIAAQNATGATSTGGKLALTSGTGTTVAGDVEIQTGGTPRVTISPTLTTLATALAITTANPASSTGTIRLAKDVTVLMRNDANSADNAVLAYSGASNILQIGPQAAGGPGLSLGGNTTIQFFVSGSQRLLLSATSLTGGTTLAALQLTGSVANQFIGAQNTSNTPANLTIGASGKASGTGSGADLVLRGGRFSTSGTGGAVRLQYNPDDASPVDRLVVDSAGIGFFGVTPVARASAYTPTNVTPDRAFDADTVAIAELADVVGTLIADLQAYGLLQ